MASLSYFAAKRHRAIFIDPLLHALPHVIAQSRKPPVRAWLGRLPPKSSNKCPERIR